jgi:hypothetical protein
MTTSQKNYTVVEIWPSHRLCHRHQPRLCRRGHRLTGERSGDEWIARLCPRTPRQATTNDDVVERKTSTFDANSGIDDRRDEDGGRVDDDAITIDVIKGDVPKEDAQDCNLFAETKPSATTKSSSDKEKRATNKRIKNEVLLLLPQFKAELCEPLRLKHWGKLISQMENVDEYTKWLFFDKSNYCRTWRSKTLTKAQENMELGIIQVKKGGRAI